MQTKLKFIIAASAALACATAAHAQSAGSFLVNAGWTYVVPKKSSFELDNGYKGNAKAQSASAFGLSGTYFITDNLAGELALSTPVSLTLKEEGGSKLGSVKQFSPALLLKYYFLNAEDKFRPYVGVGVSRVSFKKVRGGQIDGDVDVSLDFKSKWAPVANAGFTYQFTDQLFGGVSVSYMPLKSGKITATHAGDEGTVVATSKNSLKFNPITTFVSIGYKF